MWRRRKRTDYLEESRFPEPHPVARGIGPQDIQEKEFRLAFRGYNERDVDVFLDELTEEVARLRSENERLSRQAQASRTQQFDSTGALEAESVVRDAQEEAARIIRDANERAARVASEARAKAAEAEARARAAEARGREAATSAASVAEMSFVDAFLSRERAFLQSLAGLVQEHAEAVKVEYRRAREGSSAPGTRDSRAQPAQPTASAREAPPDSEGGTTPARATGTAAPGAATPVGASAQTAGRPEGAETTQALNPQDEGDDRSIRELFWGQD